MSMRRPAPTPAAIRTGRPRRPSPPALDVLRERDPASQRGTGAGSARSTGRATASSRTLGLRCVIEDETGHGWLAAALAPERVRIDPVAGHSLPSWHLVEGRWARLAPGSQPRNPTLR